MIRNKYIVSLCLLAFVLTLGSCRPRGVLSSGEMREVLVDLHKTDAMIQLAGLSYNNQEAKAIYYAQVLQRHGITQAQFDSSLVWYTANPQLFNKIYPKVMADLQAEEERYAAQWEDLRNNESLPDMSTCFFDTTYYTLRGGYYPELRTLQPDTLMHDSVDQFFPQICIFR